jgi:hypothetical protein
VVKQQVTSIASVGIIFRASNPAQIFLEVKDDGHPIMLVRRQLCFIGGNWIGEGAKGDGNTLGTFKRELKEEICFERPMRDSVELNLLGQGGVEKFVPTPITTEATPADKINLKRLKGIIGGSAVPFGDFVNTVEKAAFDAADPGNKLEGISALVSYWTVALSEDDWKGLLGLQMKFGNLSAESLTIITSLEEIIGTGTKTAFGHDRVLREFFLCRGLNMAKNLPLVPNIRSEKVGVPLPAYEDYLARYEVVKKPK